MRRRVAPTYKKKRTTVRAVVKKMLKTHDKKMYEVKHSKQHVSDGSEIYHNNFITCTTFPFRTNQGSDDPMEGIGSRVGDKVTVKGYSFKMMVELNERYSDVTFRFLLVRAAKGDTPTRDTLFQGQSGNKMIDGINYERYGIIYQKFFKLKAPNQGTQGNAVAGAGINAADSANQTLSRATRIIRGWIPGTKIAKGGVLQYENGSVTQLKFFDYHPVLYAYSNYTTLQDMWYVGRLNEFVGDLCYTDA